MSKKKQQEIIELLQSTIDKEKKKIGGGNIDIIESLSNRLDKVKDWQLKS